MLSTTLVIKDMLFAFREGNTALRKRENSFRCLRVFRCKIKFKDSPNLIFEKDNIFPRKSFGSFKYKIIKSSRDNIALVVDKIFTIMKENGEVVKITEFIFEPCKVVSQDKERFLIIHGGNKSLSIVDDKLDILANYSIDKLNVNNLFVNKFGFIHFCAGHMDKKYWFVTKI